MIFREFVAETLDAVKTLADTHAGDRDLTPMVHLELPDGRREIVAVDHRFFTEPGGIEKLVGNFVVPLVQARAAMKVAWTFTSEWSATWLGPDLKVDAVRIAVAVVIDREVDEAWVTALTPAPCDWVSLGVNRNTDAISSIQETLR